MALTCWRQSGYASSCSSWCTVSWLLWAKVEVVDGQTWVVQVCHPSASTPCTPPRWLARGGCVRVIGCRWAGFAVSWGVEGRSCSPSRSAQVRCPGAGGTRAGRCHGAGMTGGSRRGPSCAEGGTGASPLVRPARPSGGTADAPPLLGPCQAAAADAITSAADVDAGAVAWAAVGVSMLGGAGPRGEESDISA